MTRDEIAARVHSIVVEQFTRYRRGAAERVTPTSTWDELELDSLDRIEVTMAIEEAFEVEVPDHEAEEIRSVDQAVAWVAKALSVAA